MAAGSEPRGAPIDGTTESPETLRLLSRSPHPYHRYTNELPHPSERVATETARPRNQFPSTPSFKKDSSPTSDSGTEADDEQYLRRLPAPKLHPHKGVRGRKEPLSGSSTPLPTPAALLDDSQKRLVLSGSDTRERIKRRAVEKRRRSKEVLRRSTEICLLVALSGLVGANADARLEIRRWRTELQAAGLLFCSLLTLYPIRLVAWSYRRRRSWADMRLTVPSSFDPAPLLYPPVIPILVALLVAANVGGLVLPNIILAISAIPKPLVPTAQPLDAINSLHWLLSCLPLFLSDKSTTAVKAVNSTTSCAIPEEAAILLYPLHQVLCRLLHYLTTTSLLPAELQLLSVSLINLAIAALSPQAVILKAVLWGGGLSLAFLCGQVIRWGIALARVPKWRFNKPSVAVKRPSLIRRVLSLVAPRKVRKEFLKGGSDNDESSVFSDSLSDAYEVNSASPSGPRRVLSDPVVQAESRPPSPVDGKQHATGIAFQDHVQPHVASASKKAPLRSKKHTPSGRRKRSASFSVQAFFYLTPEQALARKWLYAAYVYACIVCIILLLIRPYVGSHALQGEEPVGWALGYLFGNLPWFRLEVLQNNLDGWICLPDLVADAAPDTCLSGWVQHIRHTLLGEANTRLVLAAYWLSIVVMGLAVVFQLSPIYEVDTRRKVFHFMMVAMFLPAIYVDPAYAALALSLVLAIFLLLDLLRASQLPPLSKPIASFLAPFVDGRDHRGPVVISHIFLLIGCAIPLWLSLASLPRIGVGYAKGWEIATRDISMVAGVVCVGLGDAAASLIGRRWGHHKWIWGGGKSLEGSIAFAVAVFAGLMAATVWLRLGGWPQTSGFSHDHMRNSTSASHWESLVSPMAWSATARDAGLCASMASLTEAVLTGGNDNVVVPVVLWACVKALGL